MKSRYTEQEKVDYVEKYLRSNQSIKNFAAKNGIGDKSLARWIDRYSTPIEFCEANSAMLRASARGIVAMQIPYKEFVEIVAYKVKYEELLKKHEQLTIELYNLKNA